MKSKFKTLSRTSQATLIIALLLCVGIVAYAAYSAWISKSEKSTLTKGDVMEMSLLNASATGEVVPGQSVAISPSITNTGTKDCMAYVKVEMPTYGAGADAYTFTDNSGWTKVAESSGSVTYGFNTVLHSDESTSSLCESIAMVEMSSTDFKALDDVSITVTGYLLDCDEYGTEVGEAWSQIGE